MGNRKGKNKGKGGETRQNEASANSSLCSTRSNSLSADAPEWHPSTPIVADCLKEPAPVAIEGLASKNELDNSKDSILASSGTPTAAPATAQPAHEERSAILSGALILPSTLETGSAETDTISVAQTVTDEATGTSTEISIAHEDGGAAHSCPLQDEDAKTFAIVLSAEDEDKEQETSLGRAISDGGAGGGGGGRTETGCNSGGLLNDAEFADAIPVEVTADNTKRQAGSGETLIASAGGGCSSGVREEEQEASSLCLAPPPPDNAEGSIVQADLGDSAQVPVVAAVEAVDAEASAQLQPTGGDNREDGPRDSPSPGEELREASGLTPEDDRSDRDLASEGGPSVADGVGVGDDGAAFPSDSIVEGESAGRRLGGLKKSGPVDCPRGGNTTDETSSSSSVDSSSGKEIPIVTDTPVVSDGGGDGGGGKFFSSPRWRWGVLAVTAVVVVGVFARGRRRG